MSVDCKGLMNFGCFKYGENKVVNEFFPRL